MFFLQVARAWEIAIRQALMPVVQASVTEESSSSATGAANGGSRGAKTTSDGNSNITSAKPPTAPQKPPSSSAASPASAAAPPHPASEKQQPSPSTDISQLYQVSRPWSILSRSNLRHYRVTHLDGYKLPLTYSAI